MSLTTHPVWDNTITTAIADKLRSGANTDNWIRVKWDLPGPELERKNQFPDVQPEYCSIQNYKTVVLKYVHLSLPPTSDQHTSRHAPERYHRVVAVKFGKFLKDRPEPFGTMKNEISAMKHILQTRVQNEQLTRDHLLLMTNLYWDTENLSPIMVTEFMPNHTLGDFLEDDIGLVINHFTSEQILRHKLQLCIDIASAVAYLHELKILHRDLKPINIFLDLRYRARVADFDSAAAMWIYESSQFSSWGGTEGYSAPINPKPDFLGKYVTEDDPKFVTLKNHFDELKPVVTFARDLYPMGFIFYRIWLGGPRDRRREWGYGWTLELETYQQKMYEMITKEFKRKYNQMDYVVARVIYNLMKLPVVVSSETSIDYTAFEAWSQLTAFQTSW